MKIETNISAIRTRNHVRQMVEGDLQVYEDVGGLRVGNEIYLPPAPAIKSIMTYCHEIGHIIGDELSFQAGLNENEESEVLSIDEVKDSNTLIKLTPEEQDYLLNEIFSNDTKVIDKILISISIKLLLAFTKGKFDPNSITLHAVSQEELETRVVSSNVPTLSSDQEANLISVNSKKGRNLEIPSFTTEFCCMQILENTLFHYEIFKDGHYFINNTISFIPHQRARNILARAFAGSGWRPPSMFDIKNRKS